jgi:hypothetical protein
VREGHGRDQFQAPQAHGQHRARGGADIARMRGAHQHEAYRVESILHA